MRLLAALLVIAFLLGILLNSHHAQRVSCEHSGGHLVHVDGGTECWHGVIPW